jgi:hypothetical protein
VAPSPPDTRCLNFYDQLAADKFLGAWHEAEFRIGEHD